MSMTDDNSKARGAKGPWRGREHRAVGVVWDWRAVGAVVGLAGGIVSGLVGVVLTGFSWFEGAGVVVAYVRMTGTAFLVLMIPLLIFGAHCLDLTERRKKAVRGSRFKD